MECAIAVAGPGFPAPRLSGIKIQNCLIEYVKHGIAIRGNDFRIDGNTISYIGPSGRTRRAVLIYSTNGNCFVTNNVLANSLATGNLRAIYISAGATVEDVSVGTLVIEDNTNPDGMQQLSLGDGFSGPADSFSLFVKRNTVTETGGFVVLYGTTANFGNILHQLVAEGNTFTNQHGGGGKGVFGIDDGGSGVTFRSTGAVGTHILNNHPGTIMVKPGYTLATGAVPSTVSVCCTTTMPLVTITQDAIIPASPTPVTGMYYEMSPSSFARESFVLGGGDLIYRDLATTAEANSIVAFKNRQGIHENVDYSVSIVSGRNRLTWIGTLAQGQPEALIAGDRISVTYGV